MKCFSLCSFSWERDVYSLSLSTTMGRLKLRDPKDRGHSVPTIPLLFLSPVDEQVWLTVDHCLRDENFPVSMLCICDSSISRHVMRVRALHSVCTVLQIVLEPVSFWPVNRCILYWRWCTVRSRSKCGQFGGSVR